MIDPISAFTLATSAFGMVKKLVETGREIEDVAGYLGKFFEGASAIKLAKEKADNPSPFRRLLDSGSVEQEALQATVHRQKLLQMETELRQLIMYSYGKDVYDEMLREREQIRMRRAREELKREAIQENMLWGSLALFLAGVLAYVIYLGISMSLEG
jgi:hypothetical protein